MYLCSILYCLCSNIHLTKCTGILQIYFLLICLTSAPPPAPNITNVSFTVGASFSVEWSEPAEIVDGTGFYIAPNDLNCTRDNVTISTCLYSTAHLGQVYNFTVSTYNNTPNCGTQISEATVTVNLQGTQRIYSSNANMHTSSLCRKYCNMV